MVFVELKISGKTSRRQPEKINICFHYTKSPHTVYISMQSSVAINDKIKL